MRRQTDIASTWRAVIEAWVTGSTATAICILMSSIALRFWGATPRYLNLLRAPKYPFIFIALVIMGLLLCGVPFFARLAKSLREGLFNLSFWAAFCSAVVLWLGIETHSAPSSIVLSGLLLLASAALRHPARRDSKLSAPSYYSDSPIASLSSDLVGRSRILRNVVSIITSDQPPVIAITGEYGSGKTSFVKLILAELKKFKGKDQPILVEFNPWLPNDPNALAISLFSSVVSSINDTFCLPGLDEDARQYVRVIASVIPGMRDASTLFDEPSQQSRILSLTAAIASVPRRIIVVLDDLDRMQADELEVVLKILKGGPELPNLTFICALDKTEVALIMKKTRPAQDTLKFLEKFFTVEIPLPPVDRAQLWRFLLNEFENLLYAGRTR